MIEFPCTCGHAFQLPDDEAGGFVQCPRCRRLNDVPTRTELAQIAADGTYKIEAPAPRRDPDAVAADLAYIYQKGVRDADGNEIDLRLTPEERALAGVAEPIPLADEAGPVEHGPRYDPETGELIETIELQDSGHGAPIDPSTIPMARAVFNYASGQAARRPGFIRLFVDLLTPINLAVMLGVYGMHVLLWPLLMVVLAGIMLVVVAVPFVFGGILAHYGNVIEEFGPFERDELPRPLRDVGWYEDLWAPFCNVFCSLILCYGPILLIPIASHRIPMLRPIEWAVVVACGGIGTFFFPAVLLTLQTSGTILNLRPDRVLAVIGACGRDYFVTLVVWVIAGGLYAWGWLGTTLAMVHLLNPLTLPGWLTSFALGAAVLGAAVFVMHYFCMAVGMLYRVHYDRFPWVLQRHVSTREPGQTVGLPPSRRRPRERARAAPRTARK